MLELDGEDVVEDHGLEGVPSLVETGDSVLAKEGGLVGKLLAGAKVVKTGAMTLATPGTTAVKFATSAAVPTSN
jgi:hypothetical protein